ncbi:MAG TPA: oxygenase MpaB family protein [Aeromicrobium sp.]|nr:oxygenase MpaB family protein [Aeromicrobium sp.]
MEAIIETPPAVRRGAVGLAMRLLSDPDRVRPTPAQALAFRRFADVCDPVADDLVVAMRAHGPGILRRQVEAAIEHGIEAVQSPAPEVVEFIRALEDEPFWLDRGKLALGAQAMGRVPLDLLVCLTTAITLPGSYVSPRVNDVLLHSGDLRERAAGRVAETVGWVVDCTQPGGMDRFGPGFATTARVRLIHAFIRAGIGGLDDWDTQTRGRPLNQLHYCVTMIPLLGVALGTHVLGHLQTRAERDGVIHLYRYMAHLMGVSPDLQITDLDDLFRLTWLAAWSESDPDESSRELTTAVLDAVPDLFDLSSGGRLRRRVHRNVHHDLVRLTFGHDYADVTGVDRLSLLGAPVLGAYTIRHLLPQVARRLVPGGNARAAARGHRERAVRMAVLKERLGALPYQRDGAVATVRRRHERLSF